MFHDEGGARSTDEEAAVAAPNAPEQLESVKD